jgi:DNA-binding NarL/FixJ family response regulator
MNRITSSTPALRVYLIDNHRLHCAALRYRLTRRSRFTVVGSSADVHSAIDEMRALRPDVLVLDLLIPGMNEMEAMSLVQRELPDLPIVIVTHSADERTIARAMESGARAYVSKDAEEIELMLALESACSGVPFVSPRLVSSRTVGPALGRTRPRAR